MKTQDETKTYKLIRVREKTWRRLAEIKKRLSRKEDRDVSFDQVINSLEPKKNGR